MTARRRERLGWRLALAATLGALAVAVAASAAAQSRGVTLQARPTNLGPTQNAFLTGGVSSGRTGETLMLQAKPCGSTSFRNLFVFRTGPGGRWSREYGPGVNTVVRVRWKGAFSAPVTLRQAPLVQLDQTSTREFEVGVGSLGMMWRKRVDIQQRTGGRWVRVRSVVLTKTYSSPGQSGVWTDADFTLSVPRGTVLRAVLPAAQARPCYLGSVSNPLRTQG
jgi:hypothetical protein